MRNVIKDIFFNLRMGFGIKLFGLKKSFGYYSRMRDALAGLKKNGYCRLEEYYTSKEVDDFHNECLSILDRSDEIFQKDNAIKDSLERSDGEIKIKHLQRISNKLKIYSNEFFFTLISFFFNGHPRLATVFFHLVHDGTFIHKSVPGKSERRIGGHWHFDSFDHLLKCFVLLDDITPETGGETAMILNSRKKIRHIKNAKEKFKDYISNQKYDYNEKELKELNIMTDTNVKNFYGKKGDVFFVDTSHLHRGSPLKKGIKRCLWLYF